MKKTIVKYEDIDCNEKFKVTVYTTAFRLFKELKISDEEFRKAVEYFAYIQNNSDTLDNIIRRNELSLREFEALRLLEELEKCAASQNYEIISMTTLLKSAKVKL